MAIVYIHRRKDIEDPFLNVFYVGCTTDSKRPYLKSKSKRSAKWHEIVEKYGYIVDITHSDILMEEAFSIEKYLIAFYGRKDLKKGNLLNRTDGGKEGGNVILTDETRKKLSDKLKGENHPLYGRKGKDSPNYGRKNTLETRLKMSRAQSGDRHWNWKKI
jgi:hypothetical protein